MHVVFLTHVVILQFLFSTLTGFREASVLCSLFVTFALCVRVGVCVCVCVCAYVRMCVGRAQRVVPETTPMGLGH